jgi:ATP-dependent DNA helicase DinG
MNDLGKWAVIDIETTGIDPAYDKIIDIGFLQFEGTRLVRKYSSLVKTDLQLSKFIQKLTGIKQEQIKKAPSWNKVEIEFQELKGHKLIAHNSKFEEQFLKKYLEVLPGDDYFYDSIPFLALLNPQKSTLNLESFLIELGIKDSEDHRGLEDSIDLLKVMLLATYNCHKNTAFSLFLKDKFRDFSSEEFWFKEFFYLSEEELIEIATQIEFDLIQAFQKLSEMKKFDEDLADLDPIKQDFTGENIKSVLQDESRLKTFFEDYRYRASQEEMSLKVGQAFKNKIHSIIQAPTGTGKTLGYLLPSVLLAKSRNEQVLISTGTKTLQNQAVKKDIPQMHKIVGLDNHDLKVIRLYGSKNHLCELKLRNKNQEDLIAQMQSFEETYAQIFIETYLFYNAHVENYNEILTRENVPFVLKRNIKPLKELEEEVAVDFRACTGNKCPFKNECTYLNGLKKSKEADLIIGNHALMLSWPRGMEKPRYIVIDEAHKMEGEVTNAYTLVLNQKEIEQFSTNLPSMMGSLFYILGQLENEPEGKIKVIRNEVQGLASVISDHKGPLQEAIERSMKRLQNFTDIYWNEIPMVSKAKMNSPLETSLYNHIDSLSFIFKSLYDLLTPYSVRWEPQELGDNESLLTAWSSFERMYSQIENAFTVLALLKDPKEDLVASIKYHEDQGYEFNIAPINVGELVYENVIKDSDSCVFTSATLANHDGTRGMASVEWMTGYKYIDAEKRFKNALFLDNDFNYQENVKVFLASDVPKIYSQDYVAEVMESLLSLIKDINGKTLLLFSARVRFEKAIEILLDKIDSEIPLFVQGMGQTVVENFKQAQNGILIGMESFGEGIDIPGDKLKLVYIDKIPDLRRDLIIDKRRDFYSREFGNEFVDYFLSHRTRSLHQKLGRLMRRATDSGAVIITDPRISRWKKPTLDTFVEMMNPYHFEFESLKEACSKAREFILTK